MNTLVLVIMYLIVKPLLPGQEKSEDENKTRSESMSLNSAMEQS